MYTDVEISDAVYLALMISSCRLNRTGDF